MKSLDFALLLSKYLTQYLPAQRNLSSNTICSYRDTFKLLLIFCRDMPRVLHWPIGYAIVLQAVSKIFEQIRDTPYSRMAENRIRQESNLQKSKRASVEKKIKTAQHALERFEGEILKCLDSAVALPSL